MLLEKGPVFTGLAITSVSGVLAYIGLTTSILAQLGQFLAANAEASFIVGALIVVIASAIACIAYGVWEQTAQEHPRRR